MKLGCATSKFHTYYLAIGKSSNDHESVIDHYLQESETLAKGIEVFSAGKCIRVQMGLLAYIADRPERHAILNQTQGAYLENGLFGLHSLIASTYLSVINALTRRSQICLIKGIMGTVGFNFPAVDTAASGTCCPLPPLITR